MSEIKISSKMMTGLDNYDSSEFVKFMELYNKAKIDLYKSKDADYGGSWQKDGILGAYFNLKRKIDRIVNRFTNGKLFDFKDDVTGESSIDTFIDLENYSSMNVAFLFFKSQNFETFTTFCRKIDGLSDYYEWDYEKNSVKRKQL